MGEKTRLYKCFPYGGVGFYITNNEKRTYNKNDVAAIFLNRWAYPSVQELLDHDDSWIIFTGRSCF